MIKRIEKQVIINATPQQLYNFISDPENWPQITKVTTVVKTDDTNPTYSLTLKTLLSTKNFKITITKAEPPTTFAYKNNSNVFTNESGFEITPDPQGSLLKAYTEADSGPLANALSLHGVNKNAEKNLEDTLKQIKIVMGKINPPIKNTPDPEIVSDLEEINTLLKETQENQS